MACRLCKQKGCTETLHSDVEQQQLRLDDALARVEDAERRLVNALATAIEDHHARATAEAERDAYKRAKAENDERFQIEAGQAQARASQAQTKAEDAERSAAFWKTAWHALAVDHSRLAAEHEAQGMSLARYLEQQVEWSARVFGNGLRTLGIVRHIEKELKEIEASPMDLSEWVDVIILAMDGYWRHGGRPSTLMADLRAKQTKNFSRTYARTPDDQPSEHDRTGE